MIRLLILLLLSSLLITLTQISKTYFQPRVLIIPHHNAAQAYRLKIIKEVALRRPQTKTIIILSPDHFNPNQNLITSTDSDWQLHKGQMFFDHQTGSQITSLAVLNDPAVKDDHGIYNLLPELNKSFPQAKIVPLLIGQNLIPAQLDQLSETIIQNCKKDCLLVASVDFSHYLPSGLASVHDAYSLKTLSQMDLATIMDLEVDSPQALYLAQKFAQSQTLNRFIFRSQTDSGSLMDNYEAETTSHITGWYQKGPKAPINSDTFVFATNLSFDPNLKTVGDRFFYGAATTNSNLTEKLTPHPKLTLIPHQFPSRLEKDGNKLTVYLGDDLTVGGIGHEGNLVLVFLPLAGEGNNRFFARGQDRIKALETLFRPLNSSFTTNLKAGSILLAE